MINNILNKNQAVNVKPGALTNTIDMFAAKKNTDKKTSGDKTGDIFDPIDTVDVSEEAKKKVKDFQSKLEEMRDEMRRLREELERAGEAGEGAAEMWKIEIKCLQIAMRIMSGNKVPPADHRFLMDNKPELYAKAITMKMEKVDPKELDRLSEEEEESIAGDPESAAAESTGGAEAVPEPGAEAVATDSSLVS